MAVFVTDGDQRATLAVVRALGQAGISVTVGSSRRSSLAGSSRYCAGKVCYPSPMVEREGFQAWLLDQMRRNRYQLMLPMTDVTLRLVAQMSKALAPLVSLPIPGEEQIELAQDKRKILSLAQQLGIPCPETHLLDEGQSLEDVAERMRYPVVIKPRFSWQLRNGSWVSGGVEYAYDKNDLVNKYRASHARIPYPLVQERIDGEGRGVFLLLWDGKLRAAFCHRRLREKPPWGGVSVYRESVPLDGGLVEKSLALLEAIGWQGVAMVEFKVDGRDGQAKLMEVNGRFWGSLQLASDAGMNFPVLLHRLAQHEDLPAQFDYKVGVKSRWLLGDLDQLLIRLRHSRGPNGFSGRSSSRLRACIDFLKLYERDLRYEVFRLEDPSPGWHECKSYVREMLGRFREPREGSRAH